MHRWQTFLQCKQVPEFQNLPANTIESLAHVVTEKVYPAKGVIYYQGNEVEDIFFVQQGRVKVPAHPQHVDAACVHKKQKERKTLLQASGSKSG